MFSRCWFWFLMSWNFGPVDVTGLQNQNGVPLYPRTHNHVMYWSRVFWVFLGLILSFCFMFDFFWIFCLFKKNKKVCGKTSSFVRIFVYCYFQWMFEIFQYKMAYQKVLSIIWVPQTIYLFILLYVLATKTPVRGVNGVL